MEGETADSDAYLVQVRAVVMVLTYLTINIRGSWKPKRDLMARKHYFILTKLWN